MDLLRRLPTASPTALTLAQPSPGYYVSDSQRYNLFNPTANPELYAPLCSRRDHAVLLPRMATSPLQGMAFTTSTTSPQTALSRKNWSSIHRGTSLPIRRANWASFRYVTVGVDTVAPTFSAGSCIAPAPVYQSWYGTNETAQCTARDSYQPANTDRDLVRRCASGIQGSSRPRPWMSPLRGSGAAMRQHRPIVPACDLAGNCVNV